MNKEEKAAQYAIALLSAIQTCFDDDSENPINVKELMKDNNLTHFMHALSNLAPAMVYEKFTGQDVDSLEFNHIANKLCFQYSKSVDEEE